MIALLIVLFIVAWFYDRARRRKNSRLMNIFIGIGAFFIGLSIATFLSDLLMLLFFPTGEFPKMPIRLVIAIISVWLTYQGLKAILNPAPKIEKRNALDTDLTKSERYNKDER